MKVLCLLSGGIDSPVASYLMHKANAKISFIHFQNNTLETTSVKDKVEKLVSILPKGKLFIIPFEKIQQNIIMNVPAKYRMLLYKRFMLKIAERIAKDKEYDALVTGDSLAQVASQTVENIEAIYSAVKIPILTPLLGMDKQEIVDLAKKIGTYETSILPYDDCCSLFISKSPETKAKERDMLRFESLLDENLIEQSTNYD
tara:strand:+ start:679 stop:1281 length:603 start_codon:yes stop_codon:yes gene_type:complete